MNESRSHRRLLLLRHAKSAWDTGTESDFDRPLAPRGRRDAPRVARWLLEHALIPDRILCSASVRTRETLDLMQPVLGLDPACVCFDESLYHAPKHRLEAAVASVAGDPTTLLVVAHNPGLDELLMDWFDDGLERTRKGKLMTTAAVADIEISGTWPDIGAGTADLRRLVRPKELPQPR